MATIFTVITIVAVIALLAAERRKDVDGIMLFKPIASVGFLGVGGTLISSGSGSFGIALLIGLFFAACGDVALMFRSERSFMLGLALFLIGHLAYAGAAATVAPPSTWVGLPMVGPLLITFAVTAWLWPSLGRMRVPVALYAIVITMMIVAALAVVAAPTGPISRGNILRFASGALLFYASDFAVARERFIEKSFVNRLWGLPTYYAGQLLMAWSLAPQ